MGGKIQIAASLGVIAAVVLLSAPSSAVNPTRKKSDKSNVVRIIKGESLELTDEEGEPCRRAISTTFEHNGTKLVSDTALWYVDRKMINAKGNVRLIQGDVTVTADKLDYDIDASLAQLRGELVQLKDKKNNILRTRLLDYNTRDSMAFYYGGGSMKSQDGQIIEGTEGEYNSKIRRFSFIHDVDMFADSIFVHTDSLDYFSDTKKAFFKTPVDFWKDDKMLSSYRGWYDRKSETFFFYDSVHGMSERQEGWCDSMYFYKVPEDVLMLGNAQLQDTTKNVAAIGHRIFYDKSESQMTLTEDAAVSILTKTEDEQTDTLFCGADSLIYRTIEYRNIPAGEFTASEARLEDLNSDPVTLYRQKAAKEAAQKAEEERRKREEAGDIDPNRPQNPQKRNKQLRGDGPKAPVFGSKSPEPAPADTLAPPVDTVSTPVDSSATFGFALGVGNVRMYRKDMQMCCDSMRYSDIDSVGRFYVSPMIWNEGNRQYSADSIYVLIKKGSVDRASLLSNAMVITQEDSICYDQIRSTEMMTFFSNSKLRRFDALGGADVMFFFKENGKMATLNKVNSKMLSAIFNKEGEVEKISYFDNTKNDAYPLDSLKREEFYLKGFNWDETHKPKSRYEVTSIEVRGTERRDYEAHEQTEFPYTDEYFPGYMEKVYQGIAEGKEAREAADSVSSVATPPAPAPADTSSAKTDSLRMSEAVKDSLSLNSDSLKTASALKEAADSLTPRQLKALEREKAREARKAAKEKKWDDLDRRDAEKKAARLEKRRARKRQRTREALILKQKQDAEDNAKLQRYIEEYQRRKARREAAEAKKPARKIIENIKEEKK